MADERKYLAPSDKTVGLITFSRLPLAAVAHGGRGAAGADCAARRRHVFPVDGNLDIGLHHRDRSSETQLKPLLMTWKAALIVTVGIIVFVGAVSLWASHLGHPLPPLFFAGLFIAGLATFFGLLFLLPSDE